MLSAGYERFSIAAIVPIRWTPSNRLFEQRAALFRMAPQELIK
jgi:hypothetical protein